MGDIVLAGATSGTTTLTPAAVSGTTTLTLPATTGTFITTGSTGQVINKASLPTGSVLQVVNGTRTGGVVSTTSTSDVSFGATASITPLFSTSKILVIASGTYSMYSGTETEFAISITRNGATIPTAANDGLVSAYNAPSFGQTYAITILDAPATTSSVTYLVVTHRIDAGTATIYNGVRASQQNVITLMEIAA